MILEALRQLRAPDSGWCCTKIRLKGARALVIDLSNGNGDGWLEITVYAGQAPRRAFRRLEHCAVSYRGELHDRSPEATKAIGAIVMGLARDFDAALAKTPGSSFAELLPTPRPGRLLFNEAAVLELLAPWIEIGGEVLRGWRLVEVFPAAARDDAGLPLGYLLELHEDESAARLLVSVAADSPRSAFSKTEHFAINYLKKTNPPKSAASLITSIVALLLDCRDDPALELVAPERVVDVSVERLRESREEDLTSKGSRSLNLSLSSECGQSCTFCRLKEYMPPEADSDARFERLRADLQRARDRGITILRLNGYDPLGYERVVEVIEHARALGFDRAEVHSPCWRLADRAFAARVIGALPDEVKFYVPIYGASAQVHDAVVQRPGAFKEVKQALVNITALAGKGRIVVCTVVTRQNLDSLPALVRWASAKGYSPRAQVPYPMFESKSDPYAEVAPKESEIAEMVLRLAAKGERLRVNGLKPCVLWHHPASARAPLRAWVDPTPVGSLFGAGFQREARTTGEDPGRAYWFAFPTTPCPHREVCALSTICPGATLRAYVGLYGQDEFAPVSFSEVAKRFAGLEPWSSGD